MLKRMNNSILYADDTFEQGPRCIRHSHTKNRRRDDAIGYKFWKRGCTDEWDRTARLPQMAVMSVSKRAKRPRDNAPTTVHFKYADQWVQKDSASCDSFLNLMHYFTNHLQAMRLHPASLIFKCCSYFYLIFNRGVILIKRNFLFCRSSVDPLFLFRDKRNASGKKCTVPWALYI